MHDAPTQHHSALSRFRMIMWGLVFVSGVAATLLFVFFPPQRPLGLASADFRLISTENTLFRDEDFVGTPSLVFFGYTYCPDVCPTTLAEAVAWRETLRISPDRLRIIFVTVDPERDPIPGLKTYLDAFGGHVIGLRGRTEEQTDAIKMAFGVFSEKVEDPDSTEYLVNHTAGVFMISAEGTYEGTLSYGVKEEVALAEIRRLVGI